jgi:hypothetical protein
MNNSDNFASANASISDSDFEKNEHYTEYGLAKGHKKDSKARNFLAEKQSEEREKKIAEQISQLPKKLQAKLAQEVLVKTGKTKTALKTKLFYDRQNKASQAMLLDDYAEECLAEDDVRYELREDQINVMRTEENERQYQEYLEKKNILATDQYLTTWELMFLERGIKAYETKMNAKLEKEVKTRTLLEYEEDRRKKIEADQEDDGYQAGLAMWLRYGLTKAQYDANREYEANCAALKAFYRELDYQSHPDYEMRLKAAIKKFEDDFDEEQRVQDLKDEQNDWWIYPEELENFEDRMESYEDWLERQEEDRIQSLRENAIDDMRED